MAKSAARAAEDVTPEIADELDSATFSDAELRGIGSFEEAMALASDKFGGIVDAASEIGSGFVMLDNKDKLIGEPFIILSMSFPEGDFRDADGVTSHFVVARLVTQHNDHFVITDGGHGIYSQLDEFYVRSGKSGGILVKGGLRKSEYEYTDDKGNVSPAVTYYLNV